MLVLYSICIFFPDFHDQLKKKKTHNDSGSGSRLIICDSLSYVPGFQVDFRHPPGFETILLQRTQSPLPPVKGTQTTS